MSGEDEYLGNLDVGRGVCGIDGHISNVVTSEGLDAFIYVGSAILIAMKADAAEVGLYESGLEVCDADAGAGYINAETIGESFHSCFCSTIYITACIGCITRHGADVDDLATIARNHLRYDESRHGKQTFDVGIDHGIPIVEAAFVFGFKS